MGKPEYGEPWRTMPWRDGLQEIDMRHDRVWWKDMRESERRRAIACVNALSGKKDPEEWVRRVRALTENLEEFSKHCGCDNWKKVAAALASLREVEGEET